MIIRVSTYFIISKTSLQMYTTVSNQRIEYIDIYLDKRKLRSIHFIT